MGGDLVTRFNDNLNLTSCALISFSYLSSSLCPRCVLFFLRWAHSSLRYHALSAKYFALRTNSSSSSCTLPSSHVRSLSTKTSSRFFTFFFVVFFYFLGLRFC